MSKRFPHFLYEQALSKDGYKMIVGVDEAGCGALAGPVVAGAVVLTIGSRWTGLDDSKKKTPHQREALFEEIQAQAVAWASGEASVEEINTLGIRPANYLAMRRAVEKIQEADFALVDAWTIPDLSLPQRGIIRGDQLVKSIAAASIVAKVTRDQLMRELAEQYPAYAFDQHKGYGTALHRKQIKKHGPCAIHRTSWSIFQNP